MSEATKMEKYPIGEQDFKLLREAGCVYVDKTMYIHKLLATGSKYFFISRPRRFGKSLFLSSLRYFFEGERDLFKGLYLDNVLPKDWTPYPVLQLDLNCERYADSDSLDNVLDNTFYSWERKFDIKVQYRAIGIFDEIEMKSEPHSQRFLNIVRSIHEKTGKKVVILVDEYDKPLINNLNNEKNFNRFSEKLASVFSIFKSAAQHIHFVFVTGVNQFSKFRILSDINNLRDITFSDTFSDICGFTESELTEEFHSGIERLANKKEIAFEEARKRLRLNYGGYQFTPEGSSLHNPWSILNSLAESRIGNYGIYSEILTYIAKSFDGINVNLDNAIHTRCTIDLLAGIDIKSKDPLTLLFHNGYLTIKKYQPDFESVVLGVPNREIRKGLFYLLLPYYVNIRQTTPAIVVRDIINCIELGEPEKLVKSLDTFLAGIPEKEGVKNKTAFHNALYILLKLIGLKSKTEFRISDDRVDMIIKSQNFIYTIELKFDTDNSGDTANKDENKYILPFSSGNLPVFNINATYSSDMHRLLKPEIKVLFNNL